MSLFASLADPLPVFLHYPVDVVSTFACAGCLVVRELTLITCNWKCFAHWLITFPAHLSSLSCCYCMWLQLDCSICWCLSASFASPFQAFSVNLVYNASRFISAGKFMEVILANSASNPLCIALQLDLALSTNFISLRRNLANFIFWRSGGWSRVPFNIAGFQK